MRCMHNPQICNSCISQCVDAAFTTTISGGVQDIQCPICKVCERRPFSYVCVTCKHALKVALDEREIRQTIGKQRSNWEKRLVARFQASFDMVQCANPSCDGRYMKVDIGDCASFCCVECNQSTCVECNTIVHPGRTCEENMAIRHTDDDLGSDTQKCPKCKAPVVKDGEGDCDRVICTQCLPSIPFCAKCAAPYDGQFGLRQTDNSAHEPFCKHYREPETGKPPVYTLRKDAESKTKSKKKSDSPPPPSTRFLWTMITQDDVR
jgi:hypothetical protein